MIVEKIHGMFSFSRSNWLENCISFNSQRRNQAVIDFEKDFYKLLNKAFYGKTMENVRNRKKSRIYKKQMRTKKFLNNNLN